MTRKKGNGGVHPTIKFEKAMNDLTSSLQQFTTSLENQEPVHVEAGKVSGQSGQKVAELRKAMGKMVSEGDPTTAEETNRLVEYLLIENKVAINRLNKALNDDKISRPSRVESMRKELGAISGTVKDHADTLQALRIKIANDEILDEFLPKRVKVINSVVGHLDSMAGELASKSEKLVQGALRDQVDLHQVMIKKYQAQYDGIHKTLSTSSTDDSKDDQDGWYELSDWMKAKLKLEIRGMAKRRGQPDYKFIHTDVMTMNAMHKARSEREEQEKSS